MRIVLGFSGSSMHALSWTTRRVVSQKKIFSRKTGLTQTELKGKLVLDVGGFMGRFADVATRWGARVVGIDLSAAAEVGGTQSRRAGNSSRCRRTYSRCLSRRRLRFYLQRRRAASHAELRASGESVATIFKSRRNALGMKKQRLQPVVPGSATSTANMTIACRPRDAARNSALRQLPVVHHGNGRSAEFRAAYFRRHAMPVNRR